MQGLIVDFTENEKEKSVIAGRHVVMLWSDYHDLIEEAKESGVYEVIRDSRQFVCEECGTFILPAKGLYWALVHLNDDDWMWGDLMEGLTTTYHWTDEEWELYNEGKLKHVTFLYDEKGEWTGGGDGYPLILACDEVVFRFLEGCDCDRVIRNMYENQRKG